jgi:dephospho-CoA kinase
VSHTRPLGIGLTGGIASGKTTASRLFAGHDIPVIDADEIAHALVKPGEPALTEITRQFGAHFLLPTGELDRAKLREHVFTQPDARHALEAILHPRIWEHINAQWSASVHAPYAILSIPLLVETHAAHRVDRVLVVDCDEHTQRQRLLSRPGITPALAEQLIMAQATRQQRLALADDILDNNSDIAHLTRQIHQLNMTYRQHGSSPNT